MKKTLLFAFSAAFIVIGLSIYIHKYNVKRLLAEYEALVASKVVTVDSVSLERTLLDTSYLARYAELNDSNIEQYIDDWHKASKAHQSKNTDASLTQLYDKVIEYCYKKMTIRDSLYGKDNVDFSKEDIADSSDFYVIPENIRIHKLQTDKKEKEWYLHMDVCSDSISYDVPAIDNGKPVLYLSNADYSFLSNYLSCKYERKAGDNYGERDFEKEKILCKYVPVRYTGERYYRFYSAPIISNIYHYYGDIVLDIVISGFYMEELLLKDGNEEFEVIHTYQ